jgi:hypothetical protein
MSAPAPRTASPKLGFSRPYYTDTLAVAGVAAERPLEGIRVGVDADRAGAAALESRGAERVRWRTSPPRGDRSRRRCGAWRGSGAARQGKR